MENLDMIDGLQVNGEMTILDVMGVDLCRDAILDNVHIRDIVRSERVCRRWQRAVLGFLPRCRHFTLSIHQRSRVFKHSHRTVMIRDDGTFPVRNVLEKLGPLIASLYTNRSDKEFYEHIATYCPRLRQVELKSLQTRGANNISEKQLGRAFQYIELEKFKLVKSTVTGEFLHLMNVDTLKSLCFVSCDFLHYLWPDFYFPNVTSLVIKNHMYFFHFVPNLLNKMPKLENIFLTGYIDFEYENSFVQACSRLDSLKSIDLREENIYECFLEGFARCCKKLEYLNIADTINSPYGRGLAALILRSSPGTLLCFTRVREEHKEILLEYLQPLNNELQRHGRKEITLEMLNEAFKSKAQCDMLELRLVYPADRNAKLYPLLNIILNVSFERIFNEVEPDLAELNQDFDGWVR